MKITMLESASPALRPWLTGYLFGENDAGVSEQRQVVPARPTSFINLVLEGDPVLQHRTDGSRLVFPPTTLFSLQSHDRFDITLSGRYRAVLIRLQPATATLVFDIDPVCQIDSFVPIEVPFRLVEQLRKSADWQAMIAPLDAWMLERVRGRKADDPVAREAARLRDARGQISVQELSDAAGLSLRHFQRRFRALTGLNPKHYARLCRVGHALLRKQADPAASWTTLAMESGYADQSHFIRDFRALTGTSPGDYLRSSGALLI